MVHAYYLYYPQTEEKSGMNDLKGVYKLEMFPFCLHLTYTYTMATLQHKHTRVGEYFLEGVGYIIYNFQSRQLLLG